MSLQFEKRIADPIHKTIGLTKLECQVVATRAFQRLRNVKQLGLAHYVFPGADYSRFSHSLGVCHVAGRIMEAIQRQVGEASLPDTQVQLYRLAGLCHDIGHYPYSHAMEYAVQNYYSQLMLAGPSGAGGEGGTATWIKHDQAGAKVLTNDRELLAILPADFWQQVADIFLRQGPLKYLNLTGSAKTRSTTSRHRSGCGSR